MRVDKQQRIRRLANLPHLRPARTPRPAVVIMENVKRVLGIDPGPNNCGASIIELTLRYRFNQKTGQFRHYSHVWKIIWSGMIDNTISDMRDLYNQSLEFYREVRFLSEKYKIDAMVAERFQSRGFGGTTIECISAMLGVLSHMPAVYYKLPDNNSEWTQELKQKPMQLALVTAAQWKNAFNKKQNLEATYKKIKRLNLTEHQFDAAAIAVYAMRQSMLAQYEFNNELSWRPISCFAEYLQDTEYKESYHEYTTRRRKASRSSGIC